MFKKKKKKEHACPEFWGLWNSPNNPHKDKGSEETEIQSLALQFTIPQKKKKKKNQKQNTKKIYYPSLDKLLNMSGPQSTSR